MWMMLLHLPFKFNANDDDDDDGDDDDDDDDHGAKENIFYEDFMVLLLHLMINS